MTFDAAHLKRRRNLMLWINSFAVLAAGGSAVVYFKFGQPWALAAFVAALLLGFGAQIWFIAGLRRSGKGA